MRLVEVYLQVSQLLCLFQIQQRELEPELVSTTEETDFFYNRGV